MEEEIQQGGDYWGYLLFNGVDNFVKINRIIDVEKYCQILIERRLTRSNTLLNSKI